MPKSKYLKVGDVVAVTLKEFVEMQNEDYMLFQTSPAIWRMLKAANDLGLKGRQVVEVIRRESPMGDTTEYKLVTKP